MIKEHCFTEEWLDEFKKQTAHQRIDKAILEKMIYAIHLLERIKANGLNFIFKGGTSLILYWKKEIDSPLTLTSFVKRTEKR
ncbi:MAG: hypothetical protein PHQ74_07360 [Crocinitomicaceae bacterium]|nr:hypothetical protein [Crocinitomicaceae bacterium]